MKETMKGTVKNLVHIGDEFYWQSRTIMSSIYEVTAADDGVSTRYKRCDWGFVQVWLARGCTVLIEPASENEMAYFRSLLDRATQEASK